MAKHHQILERNYPSNFKTLQLHGLVGSYNNSKSESSPGVEISCHGGGWQLMVVASGSTPHTPNMNKSKLEKGSKMKAI